MAYLNEQERDALLNELKNLSFNKARFKLSRIDSNGRLAFYRSSYRTKELWTRYELAGLGTRVTLIEEQSGTNAKSGQPEYQYAEVIVEPIPGNRT
ncbi:MAG: hypothetical protein H7175_11995 [Burkholderiales bacterium]|nr:hypothetical protein [Anaerolineae bacterium]